MSTLYLSPGLIEGTLLLLKKFNEYNCSSTEEVKKIPLPYGINKDVSIEMAKRCGLLIKNNTQYILSKQTKNLLLRFNGKEVSFELYREFLRLYIESCSPVWSNNIPKGRQEAYIYMPDDVKACFQRARLMERPLTKEVVEWWDSISNLKRFSRTEEANRTGRLGERLSIKYEQQTTGKVPLWKSMESNLAGYDIESVGANDERVLIEVKASTLPENQAKLYISENEWTIATLVSKIPFSAYIFHLWDLSKPTPELAIVSYREMSLHIPSNNGSGRWSCTEIPFSSFEDYFFPSKFLAD